MKINQKENENENKEINPLLAILTIN